MMEARRLRALLGCTTALSALAAIQPARAQAPLATPTGGAVVAGSASIAQAPGATTISQATPRAAINWQTFNVGSKATVTFRQPSSQAVTLNRVVAPDPSLIAGHINANGSIVLVNPDGIVFAHGAEVNAAGLVASAPGITNRNFMADRMIFNQPAHPNARVINQGTITIGQAGLAALVAPEVANSGVIAAKLGSVVLAGARTATLDLYGDGLVSIDVAGAVATVPMGPDGKPTKALVTNQGTIVAEGGRVLLTARAVDGLIQNLVDAGGTISANGVAGQHAGTVLVQGVGGSISIAGTLTASGAGSGGTGGAIGLDATGGVAVQKTARIDASGPAGGGVVAVGTTLARAAGGPGTPAGLTAKNVGIAHGATIGANATVSGNGGRVVVLSGAHTADHGAITAKGGPEGGNGGFVEVSGHDLGLDGRVDTSAPLGTTGTILLDPTNLVIAAGGDNDDDVPNSIPFGVNGVAWQVNGGAGIDEVSPGALEALVGNVTLQATNDIIFASNLALTGINQSLLVEAGNSITVDPGVIVSATGNIEMDASSSAIPGNVPGGQLLIEGEVTAGGNITLSAGTAGINFGESVFPLPPPGVGNVTANSGAGVLTVNTTGGVDQFSGIVSAGTLTGTANFLSLQFDNAIGTLGAFTVPTESQVSLNDTGNLTVAGPVNAPGGFINLTTTGNLTVSGTIDAPSAGFIGSQVQLSSGGNMIFAGEVNATGGTVAITASGSITEPGGAILADMLGGSSGGEALFTGVNAVGTLGFPFSVDPPVSPAFTAGGNFTFVDSTPLVLAAPITVPAGATIALTADGLTEGSQFVGSGASGCEGPFRVCGALEAPGGEVSIQPFTAGVPVALVGAGPQPAGTLSLDNALLAAITAGTLALTSFGTEPITISGANQLGGLTDPNTGAASGVATLLVKAGGAFTETAGASLNVATLTGSAASVALNGANVISTLGPFSSSGGFSLVDTEGLTVLGAVDDSTGLTFNVEAGNLQLGNGTTAGTLASAGTVSLQVPNGAILAGSGVVDAGVLTGQAKVLASIGTGSNIAALGPFTVSGGTDSQFKLTTGVAMAITGVVTVGTLAITAAGAVTEGGAGVLDVTALTGSAGAAALSGANAVESLEDFSAAGNFSLSDSIPLTLAGTVTVGTGDTLSLATDSLTEGSFLFDDAGTHFGALTAQGGTIALQPYTASVPVALVGGGAGTAGTLAIDQGLLDVFTAGTLKLASPDVEPVTVFGANTLGNLTNPNSGAASGVGALAVNAGGAFTEAAGASLNVGQLTGSAASVALNGANVIASLGPFSSTGGFRLADTVGLTVLGNVTDATGITLDLAAGNLAIGNAGTFGQLASAGTVNLQVPNGSITVPLGHVQAGTLTGVASGLANFATAHVVTLGSFSVSGGSGQFALTNNAPLTIAGPVSAAFLDIAAPGTLTLAGNIFTTGLPLAEQSGAAPALPGSVLQVLSGGVFQQLGTSVIAPLGGGEATLRIQLPAEGGAANFANLLAGGANLVLALGPGVASGTMAAGGLLIIGTGGSANLFGSVAGIPGGAAAGAARILPAVNTNYRFNGCVIQTTICAPLVVVVPQGPPAIVASGGGSTLSPSVTLPAIVLFVIPAVVGESWTDAGGFPLPNIAKLDF